MENTQQQVKEEWRPVAGYEGLYEVSDLGRVRSLDRVVIHKWAGEAMKHGKVLSLRSRRGRPGYCFAALYDGVSKKQKRMSVHRLVAICFIGNPSKKQMVNHIDGNPLNNSVSNLEWCTASENSIHSFTLGTRKPARGERHAMSKLKEIDVKAIRWLYENGFGRDRLSEMFVVSRTQIGNILNGKHWKL